MGPDHSQIEIYEESSTVFCSGTRICWVSVEAKKLTTRDMFVPTCARAMRRSPRYEPTHDPSGGCRTTSCGSDGEATELHEAQAAMKELCQNVT